MGETGEQEQPQDEENGKETGINARSLVLVAVLSLIGIAPVYSLDITLQTVFNTQISHILRSILPVLLLVPLPAAYIASISKKGFRKESLGTLATAPLALINLQMAAVAAGLILGSLMVSYKAKSIYNERNTNWVHFKAAGSMVTILAITIGLTTASFYAGTPEFREDIRGNMTEYSVDVAMDYANMADLPGTGSPDAMLGDGQAEMIGDFAGTLSQNVSTTSIQSTETIIFEAIAETQNQDGSKFDPTEQQVLRTAFDSAEDKIPGEISQQARDRVQTQFAGLDQSSGEDSSGTIRSMVTPRVRNFVDQFITGSREMAFVAFIATFSIVMMFKLPFELLSAIYAAILSKIVG